MLTQSQDLQKNITQIIKSVTTKEPRFVSRVLRQTSAIRRKLTAPVLAKTVNLAFPKTDEESAPIRERLLGFLGKDTIVCEGERKREGGEGGREGERGERERSMKWW